MKIPNEGRKVTLHSARIKSKPTKKFNKINSLGDRMNITFEDIAATVFMGVVFAIMGWAFLWAAEKERELGIDGMSSERILVRDKLGK